MSSAIYDEIGTGYARHRRADQGVLHALLKILSLPKGSCIAEIGAGTGNYSRAVADEGMKVIAVEPSVVMRGQAAPHANVHFVEGVAEHLPLSDNSVDGVFSILAFHHFSEPKKALLEMTRVCPCGPIVLFTFDPRQIGNSWFTEYFPRVWDACFSFFPPLEQIQHSLQNLIDRPVHNTVFALSSDMEDLFAGAAWNRPELYLNEQIRAGISSFALADPIEVQEGVLRLRDDLDSGQWDKKHGWLRHKKTFDAGYRFIHSRPYGVTDV